MALFNNTSFRLLEQGLDATWLKQSVTAQNIANSDTPYYNAKTVHFEAVISEVQSDFKNRVMGESKKQLDLHTYVTEETGTSQTINENNVDMEREQVALADAQIQYDTLINKMSAEFRMISSAISR